MSARTVPDALRGIVRFRQQRVFRCHYTCDDCGERWTDEMLTVSYSWCSFCEAKTEPHETEELLVDMAEFDVAEMEID